jgi:hypothetical protein
LSSLGLFARALLGFSAFTLLSGCAGVSPVAPSSPAASLAIQGVVHGGQQPVTGANIQLYAVGTTADASAATSLMTSSVQSDASGNFSLNSKYTCPGSPANVYLVATGGNPGLTAGTNNTAITMMAALGLCSSLNSSTFVFVDEVTTIGSVAALYSPYMTSAVNLGFNSATDAAAFATAFSNVAEYTNTATGSAPGPSLPGGMYASSTEINTLGNILAPCINSAGGVAGDSSACGNLFNLTKSGSVAPTNTVGAILNILNNPTQNASSLFALGGAITPFQPALTTTPSTWALPILQMAATPTFSIAGGTYSSAQFVTLSDTTTGNVIYYTTDGSTPTSSSPIYSGTITVSSSETINAIAQAGGYATSALASAAYTITGSTSTFNVSGQIIIPNCGVPSIPTMTVTLTSGSTIVQTTTSNGNGNFTFSGVPNDTYTVTPSIGGPSSVFSPTSQSVTVSGSGSSSVNFSANLGYTVSGTVSYGGPQTGRTYLSLNSTCGSGGGSTGTSISTTGAYTIRGVPPGSYTVQAWMDPLGQGVQNAIDPSGNTPLTVTAANVTNAAITMNDPTFATPTSNPTIQNIVPNPQGALILFQSSLNSSSVEDANQYLVQWSTSPALGGGGGGGQFTSVAGSHTFTASGGKGLWVLTNASLSSGQTYYFQARSFNTLDTSNPHPSGWCNYTSSGCSGTSGFTGVTIATPTCSGTCTAVSGSVTIPTAITIKSGAPLYLGLLQFSGSSGGDPIGFYVTEIASPSNSANDFTVAVPSGSNYSVIGILDQNNTGGIGAGAITNVRDKVQANLTISGSTQNVAGVTLPTSNSTATVSTQFSSNSCLSCGSPSTSYQLSFTVNESDKQPVAVTLNSGPNVPNNNGTVALDMGICTNCGNPQFEYSVSLPGTPNVGDTYGFTVTYSDGSQDTGTTVTGAVTGWNGGSTVVGAIDAPTALAPINNNSTSTTPTFTWTDSSNAIGANFYYSFYLSNSTCSGSCTTIWQVPGNNSKSNGFSNSITSIPWITSGNDVTGASNNLPTVSALTLSSIYNWFVQVQDANGNSAQTQVQYQP